MPSTNYDQKYNRVGVLGVVDVVDGYQLLDGITSVNVLDELDQNMIDFIYSIQSYSRYMYKAREQLTTITYRFYGTTTLWWIILLYNGLCTPMQLQPGMMLNIPNKREIDAYISKFVNPNNTGRIVTI